MTRRPSNMTTQQQFCIRSFTCAVILWKLFIVLCVCVCVCVIRTWRVCLFTNVPACSLRIAIFIPHICYSFLQLRAGLDPRHIHEPVETIEVPYSAEAGNAVVSCLVASNCGLMAVLEESDQNLFIYNHKRSIVLEFPLNCPGNFYANQIAFDIYNNIIIAPYEQDALLRFNMNGKALPRLEVPVSNPIGVVCSPEGELFVSSNDPCTIVKKTVGQSEWVTIYRSQEYGDVYHDVYQDDDDMDREFDPTRFTPKMLSVGSGGELFVATDNCINVLSTFDGKVKRQIGFDRYGDGNLSAVLGVFATGDGHLFVSDSDHSVHVYTTDGEYLDEIGSGVVQHPYAIAVDWKGYLFVPGILNGKIHVF